MKHLVALSATSLALLAAMLISCTRQATEPVKTVSYFQAHPEERKTWVTRCADDPGALGKTPNCQNAIQAAAIEDIGSFKDLPPLGLLPPKGDHAEKEDSHTRVRPK